MGEQGGGLCVWHKQSICVLSCSSEGQGGLGDVGSSSAAVEIGGVDETGKERAYFLPAGLLCSTLLVTFLLLLWLL